MSIDFITLYKGSDLNFTFYWPGDVNLTGYTVSLYDAHPTLAGRLVLTIEDAITGYISGYMKWDEDITFKTPMTFRPRVHSSADDSQQTLPVFTIRVL